MRSAKLILFFLVMIFVSCSVQKRKHRPGFYVHAGVQHHAAKEVRSAPRANVLPRVTPSPGSEMVLASAGEVMLLPAKKRLPPDTCDVVVFRDGSEQRAKVIEVSEDKVRYERCDMAGGPVFTEYKSKIATILYVNGQRDIFPYVESSASATQSVPAAPVEKAKKKKVHPAAALSLMAVVSAIFIPWPYGFAVAIAAFCAALFALVMVIPRSSRYKGLTVALVALLLALIVALIQYDVNM